jgi:hypothetical protein
VSSPPAQRTGVNVQAVRDALEAMRTGSGGYEAVKAAVRAAQFAVRPPLATMDDIAENWDYRPLPDSFTDTVIAARWQKVLTPEQERELRGMARFVSPDQPQEV